MTKRHPGMVAVMALVTPLAIIIDGMDATAAEIKVLGSPGVRSALRDLAPQFEQATGHKVIARFDVIDAVKRRIDGGEIFDIVIQNSDLIEDLVKQGKVAADTHTAFGRTGLGVVVPKGAPKPSIGSVDDLKRTLLSSGSVAYSSGGESGIHFFEVLKRLGIAQEMGARLKPYARLAESIEKREVDMAVTGLGPAMENPAGDFVGSLPLEVQRYVNYGAGVSASSTEPEAARALLRFLKSPNAARVLKAKGVESSADGSDVR